MKRFTLMIVFILPLILVAAVTQTDLQTMVKGKLGVIHGGTNSSSVGNLGQVLVSNGVDSFTPVDPLVSGNPTNSSQNATLTFFNPSLTSTQLVKSSTANLYGWYIYNPNTTACFLQLINNSSPSLGSTVPDMSLPFPPGPSAANVAPTVMAVHNFASAFSVAATTTPNGGTTCPLGLTVNLFYF